MALQPPSIPSPGSPVPPVSPARPLPAGVIPPPVAAANANTESATVDEKPGSEAVALNFWQLPFVQNVMPFVTALAVHAAVIVIGLAFWTVGKEIQKRIQDQILIPEAAMADGPVGGVPHPGLGGDANRDAAQDKFPDVPEDSKGISDNKSKDLTAAMGGGAGDAATDGLSLGASLAPGAGRGSGSGTGDGAGGGKGDGGGGLAPFGVPGGGGGIGPRSSFIGTGGNAKHIVFVCDATGSMMSKFDLLRVELRKGIDVLKVPQAFNIVFIQENAKPPLEKGLMLATPEVKRRAYEYVDTYAARGPTDPMPAIKLALEMKPQLMYFLIDPSDFPDKPAVLEMFRKANADHHMKLITFAFIDHDVEDEKFLAQLATENGGTFKHVSEKDLNN